MQEMWVWSLGQADPLEKRTVTHSSILAWRIPRTEEPVGLPGSVIEINRGWANKQQWTKIPYVSGHSPKKKKKDTAEHSDYKVVYWVSGMRASSSRDQQTQALVRFRGVQRKERLVGSGGPRGQGLVIWRRAELSKGAWSSSQGQVGADAPILAKATFTPHSSLKKKWGRGRWGLILPGKQQSTLWFLPTEKEHPPKKEKTS